MEQPANQNGAVALRINEDETVVVATIQPSRGEGEPVTVPEVVERLQRMGVKQGVLESAIRDAIEHAEIVKAPVVNVAVARGAAPQDGKDARQQYLLPLETLSKQPPKHRLGFPCTDWLALEPEKLVVAGQPLISIFPAQPGVAGKTVTWPPRKVPAKSGKPSTIRAGAHVQLVEGTRFEPTADGYVVLNGDTVSVTPLKVYDELVGIQMTEAHGFVVKGDVNQSRIRSESFIAIGGSVYNSTLRCDGDVIVKYAEGCEIVTPGTVYVLQGLKDCRVTVRGKVVTAPDASLVGGAIHACRAVEAHTIGAEDFTATVVQCGVDRFGEIRNKEIHDEVAACESAIQRIVKAVHSVSSKSSSVNVAGDKRALIRKLQIQKRNLENRLTSLHTERRSLNFARAEKVTGMVRVTGTAWPGVWIEIDTAKTQLETPLTAVRFQPVSGGKAVEYVSEEKKAA